RSGRQPWLCGSGWLAAFELESVVRAAADFPILRRERESGASDETTGPRPLRERVQLQAGTAAL
ncbi:MAG: hypothetical protein ACXVHB_29385, partial [Solirubrobacteraceae bacterium]